MFGDGTVGHQHLNQSFTPNLPPDLAPAHDGNEDGGEQRNDLIGG